MKLLSTTLTLLMLVGTIKADLSQYYDEDYDYYDTSQEVETRALPNQRRSEGETFTPSQGVDFTGCTKDPDSGLCCVMKEEEMQTLEKEPILECTHKNTEQCHYTYVTQFKPSQEEVCEESFDKKCSITFVKQARNETVEKCYTPLVKVCGVEAEGRRRRRFRKNAQFEDKKTCQTYYETSCTTRYVEKTPGKFVADTSCEKHPVELCGEGCRVKEGRRECHEKVVASLLDVPEEVCDLNPVKTCRFATKLVPHLSPTHQCTIVPKEVCVLKFSTPKPVSKPLISKWCLDTSDPTPGQSYDESNAVGAPLGTTSLTGGQSDSGEDDLETVSSQNQETAVGGDQTGEDSALGSYGDQELPSVTELDPDLGSGEVITEPALGTYQPTDENLEEVYQAEDSYIVPEAEESVSELEEGSQQVITLVEESYGSPNQEEETQHEASEAEESYGSPTQVDESYGLPPTSYIVSQPQQSVSESSQFYESPTTEEGSFEITSEIEDSYGSPPEEGSDDITSEAEEPYGSGETPPAETEISTSSPDLVSPVNSLYEIPSYDYDYELGSYRSNEISSYNSPQSSYKIDAGFGEESQFSYQGRGDEVPEAEDLDRHLTPPGDRARKSNQNVNKIRSVNPYYYKI